jgi:putative oxidoreductase
VQLAVAWGELLAGAALVLGLLTRLATLGVIVIQAEATYLAATLPDFSLLKTGGAEYNVALLSMCLTLLLLGGGRWAVEQFFRRAPKPSTRATPAPEAVPGDLLSAGRR